ncbi:uncharacterized protein si:ch211-266k8.4, partial [Tachysurus ichikawai]
TISSPGKSSPGSALVPKRRSSASFSLTRRKKGQSRQSQNASVPRKGPFTLQDGDGGATENSASSLTTGSTPLIPAGLDAYALQICH